MVAFRFTLRRGLNIFISLLCAMPLVQSLSECANAGDQALSAIGDGKGKRIGKGVETFWERSATGDQYCIKNSACSYDVFFPSRIDMEAQLFLDHHPSCVTIRPTSGGTCSTVPTSPTSPTAPSAAVTPDPTTPTATPKVCTIVCTTVGKYGLTTCSSPNCPGYVVPASASTNGGTGGGSGSGGGFGKGGGDGGSGNSK